MSHPCPALRKSFSRLLEIAVNSFIILSLFITTALPHAQANAAVSDQGADAPLSVRTSSGNLENLPFYHSLSDMIGNPKNIQVLGKTKSPLRTETCSLS